MTPRDVTHTAILRPDGPRAKPLRTSMRELFCSHSRVTGMCADLMELLVDTFVRKIDYI